MGGFEPKFAISREVDALNDACPGDTQICLVPDLNRLTSSVTCLKT